MKLTVVLSSRARRQIDETARWWAENRSVEQADRWEDAVTLALRSLGHRAERCSLVPEHRDFPFEVRNLPFGVGTRRTHRIVFSLRPGDIIYVFGIHHLSQDSLTSDDLS